MSDQGRAERALARVGRWLDSRGADAPMSAAPTAAQRAARMKLLKGVLAIVAGAFLVAALASLPQTVRDAVSAVGGLALLLATTLYVVHAGDTVKVQREALQRAANNDRRTILAETQETVYKCLGVKNHTPALAYLEHSALDQESLERARSRASELLESQARDMELAVRLHILAAQLPSEIALQTAALSIAVTRASTLATVLLEFEMHVQFVAAKKAVEGGTRFTRKELAQAWEVHAESHRKGSPALKWEACLDPNSLEVNQEVTRLLRPLLQDLAEAGVYVRP